MPAKVAVTGVTGFTGGALARRLLADGYEVRGLVRRIEPDLPPGMTVVSGELADRPALDRLVDGADTVFHIAAMFRTEGPREVFEAVNFQGSMNVFEAARAAGVRRFVYCSTIGVHGGLDQVPGDETSPFDPRDPYQETKLKAELAIRAEGAVSGMEVVVVRPCGIYGPGDTRLLKMFRMIQKGRFFFVGDGSPTFHPVYIDDLVEGFVLAMTSPAAAGEVFIIGAEHYVPLKDFAAAAARAIDAPPPNLRIPWGPMNLAADVCEAVFPRLGLQPPLHRRRLSFFKHRRGFSIDKAKRLLGYRPAVDLDEGFSRTVAWYREQGLLAR